MENDLEDITEKRNLCLAILENSLSIPPTYHDLITETLMKIPQKDLEKIYPIFDRVIFIEEETSGTSEHFLWQCMTKHRMKTVPPLFEGGKPSRLPMPVTFDTFAIILIERELNKIPEEEKIYVVAHELAHVFLKHRVRGSKALEGYAIEEKADTQVKKWGFKVFQRS